MISNCKFVGFVREKYGDGTVEHAVGMLQTSTIIRLSFGYPTVILRLSIGYPTVLLAALLIDN